MPGQSSNLQTLGLKRIVGLAVCIDHLKPPASALARIPCRHGLAWVRHPTIAMMQRLPFTGMPI